MGMSVGAGSGAPHARVNRPEDVAEACAALAVDCGRPVLVVVGGAGGMGAGPGVQLDDVMVRWVFPLLDRLSAVVVDGGTDSGVMRVLGRARSATGHRVPIVGVAAEGTVIVPGRGTPPSPGAAHLEPNHTGTVLVPGSSWGDESPWLGRVAEAIAGCAPTATLLVNGGEVTYADAAISVEHGRPVIVLAGTGRAADAIAAAAAGDGSDPRARVIAGSPLTTIVSLRNPAAVAAAVEAALTNHVVVPQ